MYLIGFSCFFIDLTTFRVKLEGKTLKRLDKDCKCIKSIRKVNKHWLNNQ